MKIREIITKRKYYILSTVLSFISGVIVGYSLLGFSGAMKWIGTTITFALVVNVLLWAYREIRQYKDEERKKEERVQKKLNDNVFKKWKNVSVSPYQFHIKTKIEEEIDPYLFEKAKDFLKDKDNKTREILTLWNQVDESLEDSLSFEYNKVGKRIRKKIREKLHEAYPSFQPKEARFVKIHDNCYVMDNIIRFVGFTLKPKFLKNEPVDWKKILEKQFYRDVEPPIWSLNCHGVCIQSENENNVNKKYFQNVMEYLTQSIYGDLEKLNKLEEKIYKNLNDFKEKMSQLTIDIDLRIS